MWNANDALMLMLMLMAVDGDVGVGEIKKVDLAGN